MTTLSGATIPTVEEAKVEDVESSDEDIPSLEPATQPQTGTETTSKAPLKGVSRSEKKSRKAVQRLGMKPFPGIVSVKVKKGKGQVLFVVNNPEVFKNPGSDNTYVIFGEAKVEQDNVNQALADNLAQFKQSEAAADDDIPDLVPTSADATSTTQSTLADIDNLAQLVIDQTSCSKPAAIKALNETNGDVVAAIMKVTAL